MNSSTEFYPGQLVKCVRAGAGLVDGQEYTIDKTEGGYVYLRGTDGGFYTDRFVPLNPPSRHSTPPVPKFVTGDIIRGLPNNGYVCTNYKAVMRVLGRCPDQGPIQDIEVEIISYDDDTTSEMVGKTYFVNSSLFVLETRRCRECGHEKPLPRIKVGAYQVGFTPNGIQVGCTFVDKATVLEIAKRLGENK